MARDDVYNPNDWIHFGDDYDYYDGIYIEGGNSNGSLFSAVHCLSNGRWGFYDASRTGCTFLACMTHDNARVRVVHADGTQTTTSLRNGGCFKVADSAARSVLIGCYAESDQRAAEVSTHTLIFGGAMAVDLSRGQYFFVDNSNVLHLETGVSVWSRRHDHESVKATLGATKTWEGVAFEAINETGLYPLNLKYDETTETWAWRHEHEVYMVMGTTGARNELGRAYLRGRVGRGYVYFGGGILLGHGDSPRIHLRHGGRHAGAQGEIQGVTKTQLVADVEMTFFEGYASAPPAPGSEATWNAGDRLWNTNPGLLPHQPLGWVCTDSGPPAVWCAFGAITPWPP